MRRVFALAAIALTFASIDAVVTPMFAVASPGTPGKIAYVNADGVFTVESDGSGIQHVGTFGYPTWSPDGSMLMGQQGSNRIVGVDANGLMTRNLFVPPDRRDVYRPTWSPDGKKIAVGMSGFGSSGNPEIVIVTLKTGAWVRVTNNDDWDTSPEWSPDGTRIAFWSRRDAGQGIYLLDPKTLDVSPQPIRFTNDVDEFKWSPDGTTLIWEDSGIQTFRPGVDTLYPITVPGTTGNDHSPTYSPEGTRILFTSTRTGHDDLFTVALDGGDVQQVTSSDYISEERPDWQSVRVAMSSDVDTIDYGQSGTLDVRLYPYAETANTEVVLYRSIAGGATKPFATLDLSATGHATVDIHPQRNIVYSARWAGDATSPSSISGLVQVRVTAFVRGRLRGFYARTGDFRKYHIGDPVRFIGILLPPQDGRALAVDLYKKRSHGWKYMTEARFDTGSDGVIEIGITGLPAGRYRIHDAFGGSRSNLAAIGNFTYAQVTS